MNTEQDEFHNVLAAFSTQDFIEELKRRIGTPTTVSIKIFINAEGYELEEVHRTPESLEARGISMKNVFGGYIKKDTT